MYSIGRGESRDHLGAGFTRKLPDLSPPYTAGLYSSRISALILSLLLLLTVVVARQPAHVRDTTRQYDVSYDAHTQSQAHVFTTVFMLLSVQCTA